MSDKKELVFPAVSCKVDTGFGTDPQEGINWFIGRFEQRARIARLNFSSMFSSFIVRNGSARMVVECDLAQGADVVKLKVRTDPKSWESFSRFWEILVKQRFVFGRPEGYPIVNKEEKQEAGDNQADQPIEKRTVDIAQLRKEKLDEFAYKWIDRGFTRLKGFDVYEWLSENDAPDWLTRTVLYNHLGSMYKNGEIIKRGRDYARK